MPKQITQLARPFYEHTPQHRQTLAQVPRYNEYPPPDASIFSDCGKLNEQWKPFLTGVLDVLLDESLFEGDELTRYVAQQEIYKAIWWMFDCEEDDMPQLRQSELDPCVLEQLVNGVWTVAFDFGKCLDKAMPKRNVADIVTAVAENQPIYQQTYNDITSQGLEATFPEAVNSPTDPIRDTKNTALCTAIREYVNQIGDLWQRMANQTPPSDGSFWDFLKNGALTVGSGIATWLSFANPIAAAPVWVIRLSQAGGVVNTLYNAGATGNEAYQLINDLRTAAFNAGKVPVTIDDDMRNTIICQMYNGLKDKPLTQANFDAAVQGITAGDNITQAFRAVNQWLFSSNLAYAEFVMIYSQTVAVLGTGASGYSNEDCDCAPPPLECGFNYIFNTYDGLEIPDMTFFQAVPDTSVPVEIPFVPMMDIKPTAPPQENVAVSVYAVSELPCDKPIMLVFGRATTNSGVGQIETYDGTTWTLRASYTISLGTPISTYRQIVWANNEGIVYQGARVRSRSAQPRIRQFKIG